MLRPVIYAALNSFLSLLRNQSFSITASNFTHREGGVAVEILESEKTLKKRSNSTRQWVESVSSTFHYLWKHCVILWNSQERVKWGLNQANQVVLLIERL